MNGMGIPRQPSATLLEGRPTRGGYIQPSNGWLLVLRRCMEEINVPNRGCRALTYPGGQSTWIEVGGVSSSEETAGRATSSSTYTCASGLCHELAAVV